MMIVNASRFAVVGGGGGTPEQVVAPGSDMVELDTTTGQYMSPQSGAIDDE